MPKIEVQSGGAQKKPPPARIGKPQDAESAWEFSEGVKMLLYGESGTGKTTFWATFPKPIRALMISGGSRPGELRSINTPEYRKSIDARIVKDTDQIRKLIDDDSFATYVLDHASGLQDLVLKEILGLSELPAQKGWGLATQQQYGQCTAQCKEFLRAMLSLNKDVCIVAQERNFNDKNEGGSDLLKATVGAAMTPSLVGWLNPACDYVLQTYKRPKMVKNVVTIAGKPHETLERGKGVEYCIRTAPHDVYMTKFRVPKGRPLPDEIVDPTYAKIMKVING